MEILNPWNSKPQKRVWYNEGEPVYSNGDYHIYRQSPIRYLYAYKNMAFNLLNSCKLFIVIGLNGLYYLSVATNPSMNKLMKIAKLNIPKCSHV